MDDFHGLPCWFELASADPEAAKGFYAALLGWSWGGMPMGEGMTYHVADRGAAHVAGLMAAEAGQPLGWTIYAAVRDCDALAAQAEALGGKVIVPPTDIPGTGRFAILCDPWGAGFGVLQPQPEGEGGAFDPSKPGHGAWIELFAPDPAQALAFYGALSGWVEARAMPMGPDLTYHIFAAQGRDIGGTCALPGAAPGWKPYFGVTSATAAVATVGAAGGRVLNGPDPIPGGSLTLQVADAQGLTFALVGPA